MYGQKNSINHFVSTAFADKERKVFQCIILPKAIYQYLIVVLFQLPLSSFDLQF